MQKGKKSKCTSRSHHLLMDNAKARLNDLLERFSNLQAARKEGWNSDVAVLEEQVYQGLREWKAELDVPSPANSLLDISLGSFSDDIGRLLQLYEEEDDATSPLTMQSVLKPEMQPEPNFHNLNSGNLTTFQHEYLVNSHGQGLGFQGFHQPNSSASGLQNVVVSAPDTTTLLDCQQCTLHEEFDPGLFGGTNDIEERGKNAESNNLQYISPPPSAFMGPKCALWDCTRPAQGSEWCKDYCSSFHATLALNEGPPSMAPVLRPRGINLKDNLLFDALIAKMQGKNVGIPQCEGAAVMKSPWNAAELFDLSLLDGETIREWLFFDKPRRAFDSGNRKQRSLPDYSGRGWHESRKQVMKELGGQKKSYYMDPQPAGCHEWHLFEYEINNCDLCALYRLELKLANGKKSLKGKVPKDPLADLQKKMGRLTAVVTSGNGPTLEGKERLIEKTDSGDVNCAHDHKTSGTGMGPGP
ncbi:PREDICTED: LOW QUALITY PROTEIN: transcription factor VOZ1-like [Populus euphratica]|uniref:LOW QUALITY PROTEIN: transcription factor VOZ1-like n=1 Tax=Populus euphratica TaxID=75702 RepID=A0AAJ6XZX9_POPEU|nr:PREDICTED: LOW QUALITY PROTEIN: transcription factor VOZ1-like [Populus euphratica]